MRILTFTTLFPNSTDENFGVFIYQRMAHVASRPGNQVTVVAPVPYFPRWLKSRRWNTISGIPQVEQIGGLTVHHPRYFLLPKVSMYLHGLLIFLGAFLTVRRLHRQLRFDCIDSHYVYPDCFAAVLIGKLLGLPVVASARGTDINLFPKFRFLRPMICWTLRNTAGNIGVCKALADEMVALGAPHDRVAVIGNGVDPQRFQPVDRVQARRQLNIDPQAQVVVAVGALIPRKGYHFLIPAIPAVLERSPRLIVYIVGKGDTRQLRELARAHGVEDRVIFAGSRPNEELKYWYSAADISCLVSSREGWPNVVLESLACGTPVVATGLWGVPEILVSPELGLMVQQDVDSTAAGINRALQQEWNRDKIVQYARTRTWDVVAEEVEEYLTAITGKLRKATEVSAGGPSASSKEEAVKSVSS